MDKQTHDAICEAVRRFGSQRAAAKELGVSAATINDIVRGRDGHVSRERENQLRLTLGLPSLPPKVEVDACPDCNSVHTGRCHGKKVVVRPVSQRIYNTVWAMPFGRLADAIRNRYDY